MWSSMITPAWPSRKCPRTRRRKPPSLSFRTRKPASPGMASGPHSAHRQWFQLPLSPVPSRLPEAGNQTPPHQTLLPQTNGKAGAPHGQVFVRRVESRTLYPDRLRELGLRQTLDRLTRVRRPSAVLDGLLQPSMTQGGLNCHLSPAPTLSSNAWSSVHR